MLVTGAEYGARQLIAEGTGYGKVRFWVGQNRKDQDGATSVSKTGAALWGPEGSKEWSTSMQIRRQSED